MAVSYTHLDVYKRQALLFRQQILHQRSRIVASATLQIVYLAVGVAADVPLSDINLSIRIDVYKRQ